MRSWFQDKGIFICFKRSFENVRHMFNYTDSVFDRIGRTNSMELLPYFQF